METTIENTIKSKMDSVKNIDLNLFYDVSFTETQVNLQGYLNAKNRLYCESLGFEFNLTKNNWIQAVKGEIKIVLTFN